MTRVLSEWQNRRKCSVSATHESLQGRYSALLSAHFERLNVVTKIKDPPYPSFEHFCAAVIQSFWRARKYDLIIFLKALLKWMGRIIYHVAAQKIQNFWLSSNFHKTSLENEQDRRANEEEKQIWENFVEAVTKIQRNWRRVGSTRVYRAMKDLISSMQNMGEPYALLRSICPREAQLLDIPAQAHVRFRLGGTTFPPLMYYKIFYHGNVVDINSFAPRNYAIERKAPHTTPRIAYRRNDNNGWRPVIQRFYQKTMEDPQDIYSCLKDGGGKITAPPFHYLKDWRKMASETKRQKTRIKWAAEAVRAQHETEKTARQAGPKVVPRLQLNDDLIDWSRELDFDSYLDTWRSLATSAKSEGIIPVSTSPRSARIKAGKTPRTLVSGSVLSSFSRSARFAA